MFVYRFTYLDTNLNGGRPVLTLKGKNAVPEHDEQVSRIDIYIHIFSYFMFIYLFGYNFYIYIYRL
jgi:hypothetical protein